MIKEISYTEYIQLLIIATKRFKLAYLNCDIPEDLIGVKYFKSEEGISFLRPDGYMGGLCRVFRGSENVSKVHQLHRFKLGGTFFDCYDGKLVELYKEQGFKTIAAIPFNQHFAKKGWEDSNLKSKPDVVIMSILDKPFIHVEDYKTAYEYASLQYKYLAMRYRTNLDKLVVEHHSLFGALLTLDKTYSDIADITDGFDCYDFSFVGSRDLIRKSKYKIN